MECRLVQMERRAAPCNAHCASGHWTWHVEIRTYAKACTPTDSGGLSERAREMDACLPLQHSGGPGVSVPLAQVHFGAGVATDVERDRRQDGRRSGEQHRVYRVSFPAHLARQQIAEERIDAPVESAAAGRRHLALLGDQI